MTKLEYISARFPYSMKFMAIYYNPSEKVDTLHYLSTKHGSDEFGVNGYTSNYIKPIVRNLSDISNTITHNGKTFIPIIELAKIASNSDKYEWDIIDDMAVHNNRICFFFDNKSNSFQAVDTHKETPIVIENQLKLFQKLIDWGFDLITEDCEKVYVTDEFNPYA